MQGKAKTVIGNLPLFARYALQYQFNPDITLKAKVDLKDEALFDLAWVHRLSPRVRFAFTHQLNLSSLSKDQPAPGVLFGTSVELSL